VIVAVRPGPTDADRDKAIELALNGLAHADGLSEIAARLAPLHPRHDTFPGEVLLDLATDAIAISDASRQSPMLFEDIRERYLPDGTANTKAQHHKTKFALRAAAMLHGGVDPGLLEEVQWWRTDDLWYWSLEALVAYVRAAADRAAQPVETICRRLADDRCVTFGATDPSGDHLPVGRPQPRAQPVSAPSCGSSSRATSSGAPEKVFGRP
jgi:hypothetical protein